MKKIRILALILIAALAAGIFASCGEESTEITVTLIIDADDETTFFDNKVTIDVPNPTVMNVVKEVMIMYPEVPIVLNANEDSIKDVGEFTEHQEDNMAYFWEYTINGILPDNQTGGKADAQPVKDGDVIMYIYSSYDMSQAG